MPLVKHSMTPSWIIVHHTATARDTTIINSVNEYHRTKNWGTATSPAYAKKSTLGWYVQYHCFITGDGTLTRCADDFEIRWHSGNMNDKAIGVCLTGWFDPNHDTAPSEAQTATLRALLISLAQKYAIPASNIVPHRTFANKTCYGSNLADDWAAKLITAQPPTTVAFPVYKLVGQGTLYVRVGNTLCRISTDWNTYVHNFGGSVPIIELNATDFAKFSIAQTLSVKV